jgi:hypothetical protein
MKSQVKKISELITDYELINGSLVSDDILLDEYSGVVFKVVKCGVHITVQCFLKDYSGGYIMSTKRRNDMETLKKIINHLQNEKQRIK